MKIFDPRAFYTLEMINWIVDNNELSESDITMLNNLIEQTLEHDKHYQAQTQIKINDMATALSKTFPHLKVKNPHQDGILEHRTAPRGKM